MARRGGAQQLQAEIKTDEELAAFMAKPGLLILEVYSEWCGPCLGMVGALRKVKLELGGDNLLLAICKSDTVTPLKRFNKRSEPVWLFATNGRAINICYGSDAPKLIALIVRELERFAAPTPRPTWDIGELQPVEAEAFKVKMEAIEKAERIEHEKKTKKRIDYLNYCTDLILENLPDIGVTVFGPQVSRDMFKKLAEPAEHLKMQCKDRKYLEVFATDFETINYACKNPLPADVIEQLDGKELLICFWKIDEAAGPIPHVLAAYAHELTKERVAPPDDEINVPHPIPPIISPLKVKFEVEVEEGETWVEEVSSEEERQKAALAKVAEKAKSITRLQEDTRQKEEGADDVDEEEASEEEEAVQVAQPQYPGMTFDLDMGLDDNVIVSEEEVEEEEEAPKPLTRTKRVKIPPIWVANNRRTHAALIYTFFRSQTSGFLPPDPPPEPPHIVMAFEAYKRDDIMEVVEASREDIPQYGFFTNDSPGDAKLITNSIYKYDELKEPAAADRFVLKVNKVQSYTMLSLVQFEPTYCSNNVKSGRLDALKFFPEEYKTDDEIPPEMPKKPKKKKKIPVAEVAEEQPSGARESQGTELEKAVEAAEGAAAEAEAAPKEGEAAVAEPQPVDAQPVEGQPSEAPAPEAAATTDPAAAHTEAAPPAAEGAAPEAPKEEVTAEPAEAAPAAEAAAPTEPEAPTQPQPAE